MQQRHYIWLGIVTTGKTADIILYYTTGRLAARIKKTTKRQKRNQRQQQTGRADRGGDISLFIYFVSPCDETGSLRILPSLFRIVLCLLFCACQVPRSRLLRTI